MGTNSQEKMLLLKHRIVEKAPLGPAGQYEEVTVPKHVIEETIRDVAKAPGRSSSRQKP